MKCPIKGVSEDCADCIDTMWDGCVYIVAWRTRTVKSIPYEPLIDRSIGLRKGETPTIRELKAIWGELNAR